MKILFITRWFPPCSGIFVERHAQAVALYEDLTILAILPGPADGRRLSVEDLAGRPGCPVIRCFYRPSSFPVALIARFINLCRFFRGSFMGYRYAVRLHGPFDLLHANILTRSAVLPWLVNIFTGKPYIITEHWTRYLRENWGFSGISRRFFTRRIVRRAVAVTTVSEFLANAMKECGLSNPRYVVIPNAIDRCLFSVADTPVKEGPKKILHVSTLHEPSKNIHGMLRAIRRLYEERQDFELAIAGGNEPWLARAEKYAASLGLSAPAVTFLGRVMPADLAPIYRKSSFLLMFSNFESFSVVIPEALACGIPVLATSAGAIPEYFIADEGILVTPRNESRLLEGLHYMLDHCSSYDPQRLEELVSKKFSFETVGKEFDELYRSVQR